MTIAGSQDLRRVGFVEQEVDDVQEALEITVLEVVSHGNEGGRDTRSNADSVLDIKVLKVEPSDIAIP